MTDHDATGGDTHGGEPACYAGLAGLDVRDDAPWTRVDVDVLTGDGPGSVWSLPHGGDLDANVVRLGPGDSIGDHVNDEVDVLVIGSAGEAEVACGDLTTVIGPGVAILLPRGIRRAIRAGEAGVTYFSVHRRRGPLTIGSGPASA